MYDLTGTLAADPEMTLFRKALLATGLDELLQGEGPLTIFAPTDAAFARLDKGQLSSWQKPHYYAYLNIVLNHHIVQGKIYREALSDGMILYTIDGQRLQVKISGAEIYLNNARIQKQDTPATNGIIHHVGDVIFNS